MKTFALAHKKGLIVLLVVILAATAGLGAWYYLARSGGDPVYVYPFHFIGMTEYWGDSQESYGPVTTDKIQTVFLSETQSITEISVKQGDKVKKGDVLLHFDTTLSDLQLERKRLDVEKLKLQLQDAERKLVEIKNMVPLESIQVQQDTYYDENLGPMINGAGFEILEDIQYHGGSEYQPMILWLSNSQWLTQGILAQLRDMSVYLQTLANQTTMTDGSILYDPVAVGEFYVVVRVTENDQKFAGKSTWQGLRVNASDYSLQFFTPMVADPMDAQEGYYEQPMDMGSYYTAAQIAQMRSETEKKIKDLDFQIKMAEAEYKIMLSEVSDGNVYAEIDGEVVSLLTEEEAKASRQPIVKVSGGGGFYVEGYVNELEKEALLIGMEVEISDWNTGGSYTGEVASIGDFPSQENRFNGMGNPNSSYYPFKVFVDGSADLQSGSYVSLRYSTSEGGNGVYLENPFLRTENGQSYVLVLGADGRLEQRFVTTGKSLWGNYTEIKAGLTADDLIAFPYGKNVKPGVKAVEGDMSNLYG